MAFKKMLIFSKLIESGQDNTVKTKLLANETATNVVRDRQLWLTVSSRNVQFKKYIARMNSWSMNTIV